jgi:hypothetical protein
MDLKPLEQWICDTCGDVIEEPSHGYIEWVHDEQMRSYGFRICHHPTHSPRTKAAGGLGSGVDCYIYDDRPRSSVSLEDVTGFRGMTRMLAMLDVGEVHDKKAAHLMRVKDVREWVYVFRRLFTPSFEQARKYIAEAEADGFYAETNEVWPYLESNLRAVIEKYGE